MPLGVPWAGAVWLCWLWKLPPVELNAGRDPRLALYHLRRAQVTASPVLGTGTGHPAGASGAEQPGEPGWRRLCTSENTCSLGWGPCTSGC